MRMVFAICRTIFALFIFPPLFWCSLNFPQPLRLFLERSVCIGGALIGRIQSLSSEIQDLEGGCKTVLPTNWWFGSVGWGFESLAFVEGRWETTPEDHPPRAPRLLPASL